jgi:xylan 1,4-beta-xylosidase
MWAMDLIHHDGLFYLYVPVRLRTADGSLSFSNYVVTAKDPAGPWSEPVDLRFGGIDPGHVVDRDGRRFIYVNAGRVIALTPDGLGATGELVTVYDGWDIPEDWTIECHCLESPKLFWRGEWCYMVSAQGGTVGPSTSHMVVVARSKSALGPWENAPDSPLLRTWHRDELWWSQGHGTLIEATDGSWWMMYHAIPREGRSLGRNTLLVPIKWSADGWPYVPLEADPSIAMRKPPGENVGHGLPLSDRFDGPQLGLQWDPLGIAEHDAPPARVEQGQLILPARGDGPENAARLGVLPVNGSYEITVEVHAPPGTDAGLGLFSGSAFTGLSLRDGIVRHPRRGQNQADQRYADGHVFLKVRNVDHDVTFFHSADGLTWHKYHWGANLSTEIAARAGFYAAGDGEVRFDNFTYRGL